MPPYVSRKRSRTPDLAEKPSPHKKRAVTSVQPVKRNRTTLFNAIDTPQAAQRSASDNKRFLNRFGGSDDESDSDSEADSDDFEDVPVPAAKTDVVNEDDDIEWENTVETNKPADATLNDHDIQDVSISVNDDGSYIEPLVSAATGKKGPSKRDRQVRALTHTLHVQTLMWHNTVRNSWINDATVQKALIDALPPGANEEIKRWKRDMGLLSAEELQMEKEAAARKSKARSKKKGNKHDLKGRDWAHSADHAEMGTVNLSHGDPLLRLLKYLASYWRSRFTITAAGLRKKGYMPLRRLGDYVRTWEKNRGVEESGELIEGLAGFRRLAKVHEGSRDVGAQLFVSLLRALGLEVRMVANLQPAGFGFSKAEEAPPYKGPSGSTGATSAKSKPPAKLPPPKLREALTPKQTKKSLEPVKPVRRPPRGDQSQPINIDDTDSSLTDLPSEEDGDDASINGVSDNSVVDMTPRPRKPSKFDRDLPKPVYWAEVLSPVSNSWIPVDAMVMRTVANNDELLQTFEPRGGQAERSRQVICYTIAFNADGTAKDVTVRYLKKHQLPGKTKGMRMPVEKVPIYNHRGKIRKYEEYDWFHELMLYYEKPQKKRTVADDLEEAGVLKPFKPSTENKVIENESLAWYKASAEFVLAEHFRREEALLPGAEAVKTFTTGKGDKAKSYQVYRREDVVVCKTVESWHKEGRGLLPGEQPLKYVPIRAVTLQRKREIEDAQRETGEKPQQGLYSIDQTDWIIPPPIVEGIIPTNAFGNMDVFAPTMVPAGAVHLPLKGSAKICRKLQISHAEACTGFEFGNQRAVPVLTGVVVARENATLVRQAWREQQAEIKRKEDIKRRDVALHWWRKMLISMRVIDRMKADYADSANTERDFNPFVRKAAQIQDTQGASTSTGGGGFLLSDDEQSDHAADTTPGHELSNPSGRTLEESDFGGGFLATDNPSHHDDVSAMGNMVTPVSLQSLHVSTVEGMRNSAITKRKADPKSSKPAFSKASQVKSPETSKRARENRVLASLSTDEETSAISSQEESDKDLHLDKPNNKATSNGRLDRVKATPTRSPYFNSQEDSKLSSDESAGEVITLRRTTARTRGRK